MKCMVIYIILYYLWIVQDFPSNHLMYLFNEIYNIEKKR